MATNSNISNLIASYNEESNQFGGNLLTKDDATEQVGAPITKNVEKGSVFQDDSGQWRRTKELDIGVFQTGPEIDAQQAKEEIPRRLNEYQKVLEPLDAQILQINDEINVQLAKIPQAVTDAIGHGCSIVSAGHGNGILYIGGEPVGMGSTVFTDLAMIEDYGNIDKYNANNPFGNDKLINLTSSTVARGVKNRNFNSPKGVKDPDYGTITSTSLSPMMEKINNWPSSQTSGNDPDCRECNDSIDDAVEEIARLRQLRDEKLSDINKLKDARFQDQIEDWTHKQEDTVVEEYGNTTASIVNTLNSVQIEEPSVVTEGLLLHFNARNNSSFLAGGTDWKDLSGKGYHGVMVGDKVSKNTAFESFEFNGGNNTQVHGQGIFITGLNYVSGDSDQIHNMTIETWVRSDSGTISGRTGNQRIIISFDRSTAWRFGIGTDQRNLSSGKPALGFTNNNGGSETTNDEYASSYTGDLNDDNWHQVAVTFSSDPSGVSGISTSSLINFYVDGVGIHTITGTHTPIGSQVDTETPTYGWIGNGSSARFEGDSGTEPSHMFDGEIANIKYYNIALSATQILANFNILREEYGL